MDNLSASQQANSSSNGDIDSIAQQSDPCPAAQAQGLGRGPRQCRISVPAPQAPRLELPRGRCDGIPGQFLTQFRVAPSGTLEGVQDPETGDGFLTLAQAARTLPGKVSPNCAWRWCRRGALARSGERVYLEHVRLGRRLLTKARWLERFGGSLTDHDGAYFRHTTPRKGEAERRKGIDEQLDREGGSRTA